MMVILDSEIYKRAEKYEICNIKLAVKGTPVYSMKDKTRRQYVA